MLLMALPIEHLVTFNQYNNAKTLFAAIETRFGGNEATKKTQKTLLKQLYENFSASSIKYLDLIFNRLQKLISQLAVLGVFHSQEDLNLKFLKSLPSKWNTHMVFWRNKLDLDIMSLDDLYNNYKIVQQESYMDDDEAPTNMAFMALSDSEEIYPTSLTSRSLMDDMLHLREELKVVRLLAKVQSELNRVLVVKPYFKTPYELFRGRTHALSLMIPFGFSAGTNFNDFAGKGASFDAGQSSLEEGPSQYYILMPLWNDGLLFDSFSKDSDGANPDTDGLSTKSKIDNQERPNYEYNTKDINTVRPSINTARLISWQCEKQTMVATSSTKAEYVAAASCYGQ
nr:ribonuclease H-like domain-containing protein [Tanacetum cinerariifolium]